MNKNRTRPAPRNARNACERIAQRLDDLAKRKGSYANAARIALLRRVLFLDVDALEKSGEVQLPR